MGNPPHSLGWAPASSKAFPPTGRFLLRCYGLWAVDRIMKPQGQLNFFWVVRLRLNPIEKSQTLFQVLECVINAGRFAVRRDQTLFEVLGRFPTDPVPGVLPRVIVDNPWGNRNQRSWSGRPFEPGTGHFLFAKHFLAGPRASESSTVPCTSITWPASAPICRARKPGVGGRGATARRPPRRTTGTSHSWLSHSS